MVLGHDRQIRHPTRDPEARQENPAARCVELRRRRGGDRDHLAAQSPGDQPPGDPPGRPRRHPRDRPLDAAPRAAAVLARGRGADGRAHPVPSAGRRRDGPRRGAGRHAAVSLRRERLARGRRRQGEPRPQDVPALSPRRPRLGGRPDRARGGLRVPRRRADRRRAALRPARARHRQPLQPAGRHVARAEPARARRQLPGAPHLGRRGLAQEDDAPAHRDQGHHDAARRQARRSRRGWS